MNLREVLQTTATEASALRQDKVLLVGVAVFLSILSVYALPLLSPAQMVVFSETIADMALISVCAVSMTVSFPKIEHLEERRFWKYLQSAFGLFFLVEIIFRVTAGNEWRYLQDISTDSFCLLAYLVVCLAITSNPHLKSGWSLENPGVRFCNYGAMVFVFGIMGYFILIPFGHNQTEYRMRLPSLSMFIILDLYLVGRLAFLAWRVRSIRWKRIYGLLGLSYAIWAVCDTLSYLDYSKIIHFQVGTVEDLLWYLPFLPVILAARSRLLPDRPNEKIVRGYEEALAQTTQPRASLLLLYTFFIPFVHFLLYSLGLMDTDCLKAREALVVAAMGGIGVLALLEHLAWQKKTRDLQKNLEVVNEQLRQAQKMEAVGQLAGGVAHDFNNLLAIIMGYAEQVELGLEGSSELRPHVSEVQKAAARAATLTQQLLAFSRKQVIKPQVLDLNGAVAEAETMLRRLIGADIQFATQCDVAGVYVKADPTQIQQVILNLAVNARDAMPSGGMLRLETASVALTENETRVYADLKPGLYARLTVSDTGTGIPQEKIPHIFEPFFTTKGIGKGTGLGLSTVYGIVRQSGGYVSVQSQLGQGTAFQVFFPMVEQPMQLPLVQFAPEVLEKGKETILLAEDEKALRELVSEGLRINGYEVLASHDGASALALAREHNAPIDILVTDVVMPGMNGRELAQRMMEERPGLRVLFISGYTQDALSHRGVMNPGMVLLSKPFSIAALRVKIREILDAPNIPSFPLPPAQAAPVVSQV